MKRGVRIIIPYSFDTMIPHCIVIVISDDTFDILSLRLKVTLPGLRKSHDHSWMFDEMRLRGSFFNLFHTQKLNPLKSNLKISFSSSSSLFLSVIVGIREREEEGQINLGNNPDLSPRIPQGGSFFCFCVIYYSRNIKSCGIIHVSVGRTQQSQRTKWVYVTVIIDNINFC